jgi:signal transduction histidine kinase
MSPGKQAQVAFGGAALLLILSGLAAYFTLDRLLESARWVVHTHEVLSALGDVDTAVARAGRDRNAYVTTGDESSRSDFSSAVQQVDQKLLRVKELLADNPDQLARSQRLETVVKQRVALFGASVDLRAKRGPDDHGQTELAAQGVPYSSQITSISREMRDQEQVLLTLRTRTSHHLLVQAIVILVTTFVLALLLFSANYRLLTVELRARAGAERVARESEESLRRLTVRLLVLQDEERRRFSRELHDGLGQYLVGVKMNLDMYCEKHPGDSVLVEALQLLEQSIAETRTISHLLHPPLLDEAGFGSAATWYVEGFAQRSGIEVKIEIPDDVGRLPKPLELCLFRVLQESLTNIHRHSKSPRAEVSFTLSRDHVCLKVTDHGKGIPPDLLANFEEKGIGAGVGLAGMRERIRELGGQFLLRSSVMGTSVKVTMPRAEWPAALDAPAAD